MDHTLTTSPKPIYALSIGFRSLCLCESSDLRSRLQEKAPMPTLVSGSPFQVDNVTLQRLPSNS